MKYCVFSSSIQGLQVDHLEDNSKKGGRVWWLLELAWWQWKGNKVGFSGILDINRYDLGVHRI